MSPILGIIASQNYSRVAPDTGAMFPLGVVTVGSTSVADITFSSIPSTYTHLQIRGIGQDNRATYGISEFALQFNGDTASNYSMHGLYGNGASAIGEYETNTTYIRANGALGTLVGGTFGAFVIDILDYKNTSKYKTTRNLCGVDINGTIAGFGGRAALWSGSWRNTNAINAIKLYSTNGNLQQYTSFALYGIKGA